MIRVMWWTVAVAGKLHICDGTQSIATLAQLYEHVPTKRGLLIDETLAINNSVSTPIKHCVSFLDFFEDHSVLVYESRRMYLFVGYWMCVCISISSGAKR